MAIIIQTACYSQQAESLHATIFNLDETKLNEYVANKDSHHQLYYRNKITFIKVLFNQIKASDDIIDNLEESIDIYEDIDFKIPQNKLYYIGESKLMLSLIQMKKGNEFKSAKLFMNAYNTYADNLEKYPNHTASKVPLNFMELSASILPNSLKWITSLFGLKSDKQKAIKALQRLHNDKSLPTLEAYQFELLSLYLNLQLEIKLFNPQAKIESSVHALLTAQNLGKGKKFLPMIKYLNTMNNTLSLKHFLLGKAYFITRNPKSKAALNRYISSKHTSTNLTSTYFYLYQLDILNGKTNSTYKSLVEKDNKLANYRDKWAKQEIKTEQYPLLINIRIDFDNGQYQTCVDRLTKRSDLSSNELYYLINSYIELNKLDIAEKRFKSLVTRYKKGEYYIPKTAFNLAVKFQKSNSSKAIEYLKSIKDYDDYQYQKEIETKAEMLQKQLKN